MKKHLILIVCLLLASCSQHIPDEPIETNTTNELKLIREHVDGHNITIISQEDSRFLFSYTSEQDYSGMNQTVLHTGEIRIFDDKVTYLVLDNQWDVLNEQAIVNYSFSGKGRIQVDSICDNPKSTIQARYVGETLNIDAWFPEMCDDTEFTYKLENTSFPPGLKIFFSKNYCDCKGALGKFNIPIIEPFGDIELFVNKEPIETFDNSRYACSPKETFTCPPGYSCVLDKNNPHLNGVCVVKTGFIQDNNETLIQKYLTTNSQT